MDLNLKNLDTQIELFTTHQLWVPELDMPLARCDHSCDRLCLLGRVLRS